MHKIPCDYNNSLSIISSYITVVRGIKEWKFDLKKLAHLLIVDYSPQLIKDYADALGVISCTMVIYGRENYTLADSYYEDFFNAYRRCLMDVFNCFFADKEIDDN